MRYIFLISLFFVKTTAAQLRLSSLPSAGKPVKIRYEGHPDSLITFFYDKDKRTGSTKGSSITVPPNTVLLHVVARNAGSEMFPVYAKGKVVPFAYYRMAELSSRIPLDEAPLKTDIPQQVRYMQQEFNVNPTAKTLFRQKYLNLLANSTDTSHKTLLVQELRNHHSDNEMELTMAYRYLQFLGEQQVADSFAVILRTKFPTGTFVKEERVLTIRQENDLAAKVKLYEDFIRQIPPGRDPLYNQLYQHMGMASLPDGDVYFRLIADKRERATAYNQAAIATKQISWAEKAIQATDTTQRMAFWDAYQTMGNLLYDQRAYAAAMPYVTSAYQHTKSKDATTLYLKLLIATNQQQEAANLLEALIASGKATVAMKAMYAQLGHTAGDTQADSATVHKVRSEMIREEMANIVLKDINDQTISLLDLRGKVVVVDFWATWCKPCIASFPAMQQVMQQHTDVVFLYIATSDSLYAVKEFAKANPYPFRYVMDEKIKGSQFKAYLQFKASGVPYKLVIDKEGLIRYRSGGFAGNDDALIQEMGIVLKELQ